MTVKDMNRWTQNEDGSWSRRPGFEANDKAPPAPDVYATQGALNAAKALGIDITTITGTGKDGRITKPDVEAHV